MVKKTLTLWIGRVVHLIKDREYISFPILVEAPCKCSATELILDVFQKQNPDASNLKMGDLGYEPGPYRIVISASSQD